MNPPLPLPPPPSRKRRRWPWILAAVLLVTAIAVGLALAKSGGEPPIPVTTEKAAVRDITQLVSATGKVQPEVEVKISAEVAGEIIELPVKDGQAVLRGDLLARVRPDFYLRAVEQQEAALAAARAGVQQAKAIARQRELDLRDAEALYRDKVRSEADYRAMQASCESALAGVAAAEAQVSAAEASLRQARESLEKTTIRAPMDATVTALNVELGDRVVATGQFAGTEIMRLADLERMEIRVNVNENDVVHVKPGDTARVTVDAYDRRTFSGRVRQIANSARTAAGGTQEEVTNFEVRIRVTDPGVPLRPGMSGTADIETQTVRGVVSVPIQSVAVRTRDNKTTEELEKERTQAAEQARGEGAAIAEDDAAAQRRKERADRANTQRVVFVREGDKVRQRTVETGLSDNSHIAISSGLAAGEEVVIGSYGAITRRLKDGSRVTVETPKPPAPAQ